MKRIFLSLGFVALAFLALANPVSIQTAQTVATHFLVSKGANSNSALKLTKSYTSNTSTQQTAFYIFTITNGKGFVIVSGDDAVKPILAYSTTNLFPEQVTNKEVAYWMDGYNQQISQVISKGTQASPEMVAHWNDLLTLTPATGTNGNTSNKPTDVSPMLLSEWDQQSPYWGGNLYNNLCPDDAPTGCVATAMAQIMYFWKHPAIGTGTHSYNSAYAGTTLSANFGATTYDWANMPPTLVNSSSSAAKNAVAKLMYHCGVSVNMNYGANASGAQVITASSNICSQNALKDYFGYKNTITGNVRANYGDEQWIKMLKFELDNGRPVIYTGFGDQGGHAFDFDGYDNNDYFHINWGWSGQSDGYFTIDDLDPLSLGTGGGSGGFNDGQQALIMIEPANSTLPANPYVATLKINTIINQSSNTIIYNQPYTISVKIKNFGSAAFTNNGVALIAENATNSNVFFLLDQRTVSVPVLTNYSYDYSTTGNSNLVPGSYKMNFVYSMEDITNALIPDGNGHNSVLLTVTNAPTGISNTALNEQEISIFPNPASEFISFDWTSFNGKVTGIELFNVLGQKVYQNQKLNGTNIKISVNNLAAGNYGMRIITDKGNFTKKVVVK